MGPLAGIAPVGNAPVPGRPVAGRPGAEEGAAAGGLPGLAAMRMPHTSQKSWLAES
jgi:hypothetical protein